MSEEKRWTQPSIRLAGEQAREWSRSRKLVARVEATGLGTDVRFIVMSLEGRGKTLYEKVFCARGNAENLIKDMNRFTPPVLPNLAIFADAGHPAPALRS